jgi:hypothetical protein
MAFLGPNVCFDPKRTFPTVQLTLLPDSRFNPLR